jgi:hypothetical protein
MSDLVIEFIDAPQGAFIGTSELSFEIIDESEVRVVKKTKPVKAYFSNGVYIRNSDGWQDIDFEFYSSLVSIKVTRMNNKGLIAILDDIVEFRRLTSDYANTLCNRLRDAGAVFSVYHDEEVVNG